MIVSEARFDRYLRQYEGNLAMASRLYAWNVELSAAFWGPISILEIAVRNAVHERMKLGRQEDWWLVVELCDSELEQLARAHESVKRKGIMDPTPDDIVADLNFGFWVAIVGEGIARHPTLSYETSFWQPRLKHAFPNNPTMKRKGLHDALQRVRALRNRIAHHEAIYNIPVQQTRELILEVIGFIDSDAATWVGEVDRITQVEARKRDAISGKACVL